MNGNGERSVRLAAFNNLIIALPACSLTALKHKQTWTSPDGSTQNQIDYVLVSRQHYDFEKAFVSVHKENLWSIMKCYGIPDKLVRMVQMMYKNTECAVMDEGEESEWFNLKSGVKQGFVMSGFLLLFVLDL